MQKCSAFGREGLRANMQIQIQFIYQQQLENDTTD